MNDNLMAARLGVVVEVDLNRGKVGDRIHGLCLFEAIHTNAGNFDAFYTLTTFYVHFACDEPVNASANNTTTEDNKSSPRLIQISLALSLPL